MRRTITEVHETKKSNSSYGTWATGVTVLIDYGNGTTRVAPDVMFTFKKTDALAIQKGMVFADG